MNRIALAAALLTLATFLMPSGAPGASFVLYREIFPNNTTGSNINNPAASTDTAWFVHEGSGGALDTDWILASNAGDTGPTGNIPINSNPAYDANAGRSYLWNGSGSNTNYLMWTNEYTVNRANWNVEEIRWFQRNESSADAIRAAVQIGGDWYASDASFPQFSPGSLPANDEFKQLDFTSAQWRSLNFSAGSALSLGAPTPLPSTGDVTGFGWYSGTRNSTLRLDSFEIRAEPKSPPAVLYREIFPNNTTQNINNPAASTDTAWFVYEGPNAALDTDWLLANNAGDTGLTGDIPINSNPAYAALGDRSYLWNGSGANNTSYLMWTNEHSVDRNFWHVTEIAWWQNNSAADPIRVALEIDGEWYASDENFGGTGAVHRSLDMGMAAWRSLDFDAGDSLALGAVTNLPNAGTITAFGWFTENRTNTLRLDSFEIRGVPEPGAWLLVISALAWVSLWRRSRGS